MLRRFAGWLMGLMPCGDPGCPWCAPRLMKRERWACSLGSHFPYLRTNLDGSYYQGCKFCDYHPDRGVRI